MPPAPLTAGQISTLRRLGDAVRRSGAGDRGPAIGQLVRTARTYHRDRAGWPDIAQAAGIDLLLLREWLERNGPEPRRSHTLLDLTSRPSHGGASGSGVLACTGHAEPAGNDFPRELAVIRSRVEPRHVLTERVLLELAELPRCLERCRPRILHIAAHSVDGAVFLAQNAVPVSIRHGALTHTIGLARHRPAVVVLNFCDSIRLRNDIVRLGISALCWPSTANDTQCCELADTLYRGLAAGLNIGDSLTDAHITLSRWDGLARPRLFGDGSITL